MRRMGWILAQYSGDCSGGVRLERERLQPFNPSVASFRFWPV